MASKVGKFSLADAYAAYGSQGLTEAGRRERKIMIGVIAFGVFLLVAGISSLALSIILKISFLSLPAIVCWSSFQTAFLILGSILITGAAFRLAQKLPEKQIGELLAPPPPPADNKDPQEVDAK
jgi:hypothetical protein